MPISSLNDASPVIILISDHTPGLLPLILEHVYSFAESWHFARQAEVGIGCTIQEFRSINGLCTQLCERSHGDKSKGLWKGVKSSFLFEFTIC